MDFKGQIQMSNQGDNNSGGFFQRLKSWSEIGTAVIGFVVTLIGFIKLASGDTGFITQVLIIFGIVVLLLFCGYVYFYWKPNLISRRVALAGMFAIPILSIASFYIWQHLPTKDIIVLLADFENSNEQKDYRVTKNIFDKLEDATRSYSDIKIQRLNQIVTSQKDARKEAGKRKATIVIWGDYGKTATTVQLSSHFEVLRPPEYLPKIEGLEQTAAVSELNSFKMQTSLSNRMVYLSLFTVGLTRYTVSDWNKAITSFSDALKHVEAPIKELDQSIVYFYRGLAYYYKKDYDHAIADYNQALKLDPNFAKAYYNRGLAYYYKKDYDRTIADYNQALKLDPSSADAYYNRGLAYHYKKDYDRAIADYNQALKLDPNFAKAYYNRGLAYYYKKDYDRAIADYNQALKLDPSTADAYYNRGLAYYYKKDYDRAIADYNQALKLDPSTADAYYNRGLAYKNKGSKDNAVVDFKKVLELNNDVKLSQLAQEQLQKLSTK